MKYATRCCRLGNWCTSRPVECVLVLAAVCVLWNEYLSFVFSRIKWTTLHKDPSDTEALSLLLVADPQLIGVVESNVYSPLLNPVAITDADRFLSNGFAQAYAHTQPDVVIFLGDLFDEGSNAVMSDYLSYYFRFQDIFRTDPGVKSIYIWGDNDVGGESLDRKLKQKMERFQKVFQSAEEDQNKLWSLDTVARVDFIKIDQDFGVPARIEELEAIAAASHGRYRILLNHMTLFNDELPTVYNIIQTLKADLIISSHTHQSKITRCKQCAAENIQTDNNLYLIHNDVEIPVPGRVYRFDLKNKSELVEITVPTCSYRMGELRTAYGAALLGSSGVLQYTVLPLPCRQNHFVIYEVLLLVTLLVALIKLCLNCDKVCKYVRLLVTKVLWL